MPPRQDEVVIATRLVSLIAAHQNLRTIVMRRFAIDNSLRIQRPLPATSAIGRHPHAAVFRQQRQIRRGAKRFTPKIKGQPRADHVVPLLQKVLHQLEEPGVTREKLNLVKSNNLELAAKFRLPETQDGPQITRIARRDLFRRIFIATPAADRVHPAPRVCPGLEDCDLLVPVAPQRLNLGKKMPRLARSHVADKET